LNLESLHQQLIDNVALNNFHNVTVHRLALSDRLGQTMLFVDRRTIGGWNEGTASFFSGGERTSAAEVVDVGVFDEVFAASGLKRLDVMKIDVEGAELLVLRGSARSLAHYRPRLILELSEGNFAAAGYTTNDLLRLLAAYRYELSLIAAGGKLTALPATSELPKSCNVLCSPV
jgi:FkbM family methyltransferase